MQLNSFAGQRFNPNTGRPDYCITVEEEDGSPSMTACQRLEVELGTLTDDGDGAFSYVAPGGGGDSITVNATAATNANFLDNIYIDWSLDTAATPDDITAKLDYTQTLAGNPAFAAGEVAFTTSGTTGGILFEGAANTIEGLLQWAPTTSDRTVTIQDSTHTLVGRDTTDTLTNKTIDTTNTVTIDVADITSAASATWAGQVTDETGTGVWVFGTSPTITTSLSQDGDSADAGYLRLNNTAIIGWEASPAGTDVTLAADANEEVLLDGSVGLGLDDQADLRFYETDANGTNFLAFEAPSAITTTSTCTLENDANPIPDSCVGNGTDAGGTNTYAFMHSFNNNNSSTFWCMLGGACSTTEADVDQMLLPETCTASNLRAGVQAAPGAGKSWTVCVNMNGTAVTEPCCAISDTNDTCSETVNTGSITGGQTINMEFLAAGGPPVNGRSSTIFLCQP